MSRIPVGRSKSSFLLQVLLACAVLHTAALPALAIDLAQTAEVQSLAFDEVSNRLYFLESSALKSLQLTPICEAAPPFCKVSPVLASFVTPLAVAVNGAAGLGYVTTFDGKLWRVNLNNPGVAPVVIAAEPGIPSNIVLAPEINSAYITSTRGKLWRVDLSTGQTSTIAALGFSPQALAVNAARTRAYAVQNGPIRIVEIDLSTGKQIRTLGSFGNNFFDRVSLAWTDSSETALYALIGNFGNTALLRVNLAAATASLVARFRTGGFGPGDVLTDGGGFAVNPSGSSLYLGSDHSVIRFSLSAAPDPTRVFLSIGNIPAASISTTSGYANTAGAPDAPFKVVDAPFGGTLDIFGNLTLLRDKNHRAFYYQILVSPAGAAGVPIVASWTANLWNQNDPLPHYVPTFVAPVPSGLLPGSLSGLPGVYAIPPEYQSSATAPYWSPTYLMMRWPTSDNGLYTLQIRIFNQNGNDITNFRIPPSQQSLTVLVDNTLPMAELKSIRVLDVNNNPKLVAPCVIVSPPDQNSFDFELSANDANHHLLGYSLSAFWGRSRSETILADSYSSHLDPAGHWDGFVGFSPTSLWAATCNCAHTFVLRVSKRTINGYSYILSSSSTESITINNAGSICP